MKKITAAVCAGLALAMLPFPSPADPPPWAPAHGWRKKNDPHYTGYTGKKWEKDYGVVAGRCNSAAVGAVLGGAVGGAVGSQVGKGDTRVIAIIAGTAIGAVLGAKVGREIDASDRGCFGHALELTGERRAVAWTNKATGVSYRMTPTANLKRGDQPCRAFVTEVSSGKKKDRVKGTACRSGEGVWELVS
jgi:surface antigen